MTPQLERALILMVLDYLKHQVNNSIYKKWDRGGYGEVPLPTLPYHFGVESLEDLKAIIADLEELL